MRTGTASFRKEMAEAWERGRVMLYQLGYSSPDIRLKYNRRDGEVTLTTHGTAFEGLIRAAAWARTHSDYQQQQREDEARRYPLRPDPESRDEE